MRERDREDGGTKKDSRRDREIVKKREGGERMKDRRERTEKE